MVNKAKKGQIFEQFTVTIFSYSIFYFSKESQFKKKKILTTIIFLRKIFQKDHLLITQKCLNPRPKKNKLNTLDFYYLIYLFYSLVGFKWMHIPKKILILSVFFRHIKINFLRGLLKIKIMISWFKNKKTHYKYNFIYII